MIEIKYINKNNSTLYTKKFNTDKEVVDWLISFEYMIKIVNIQRR